MQGPVVKLIIPLCICIINVGVTLLLRVNLITINNNIFTKPNSQKGEIPNQTLKIGRSGDLKSRAPLPNIRGILSSG